MWCVLNKIKSIVARRSSSAYCKWLRSQGVIIGERTYIHPLSANIDVTRPSLIKIGSDCFLNKNITILTHDFVTGVFRQMGLGFLNSSGKVVIGNNVRFGHNVMILKGVSIGDNCFIGAGSIITHDIPSNSVAVGSPCRVITTIDEFFKKRLIKSEEEAFEYARSIYERFGRRPKEEDFCEEFIWFVSGNEVEKYTKLPIKEQLGASYNNYVTTHEAKYKSFEDFLKAAGL